MLRFILRLTVRSVLTRRIIRNRIIIGSVNAGIISVIYSGFILLYNIAVLLVIKILDKLKRVIEKEIKIISSYYNNALIN